MKRLILAFSLAVFIVSSANSQTNIFGQCKMYIWNDSLKVFSLGYTKHSELNKSWVKEKLKKENVEVWIRDFLQRKFTVNISDLGESQLNILRQEQESMVSEWNKLKSLSKKGDKFLYYTTPFIYWHDLIGEEGIIVIRKCVIVGVLILSQS